MPLKSGKNNLGANIAELKKSGHKPAQAIAIAYKKAGESARSYDLNGWPEIKGNPISKVGVFDYLGAQISPDLDPDKIYKVYRPESELSDPEAIDSFKLLPWTDDHEMLGNEDDVTPAENKGVHGVIGEDVYFEEGYLKANLKIFSNRMAELIEAGKKELSIGYRCLYELASGIFDGQKYDAIQRQIRGNHLALVEEGRSGHDVAVLDHFRCTFDSKELVMPTIEEKLEMCLGKIEELEARVKNLMGVEKIEDEEENEQGEDNEADPAMFINKAEPTDDEETTKEIIEGEKEEPLPKGDLEKPKDSKSMDTKAILREISQRDSLVKQLAPHIGVFDHAEKTLNEVAAYGLKKLGLTCKKGQEAAVLQGFLAGARPTVYQAKVPARDEQINSSMVDQYLAGSI